MTKTSPCSLHDLIAQRYSARAYTQKPVEDEKIEYIMECVRLAPSACNFQPWKFLLLRSEDAQQRIQQCYPREWFNAAPLYILCLADRDKAWVRPADGKSHADIDIAIAVEHLCLAATEQGLGTCWVCNFDAALCRELFELPEHLEPAVVIPIGYTNEPAAERHNSRLPLSAITEIR